MNLLIVDDHAGVRELIRDVMRGIASNVRECASGEEAVLLCETYSPDCVTLDLRMGEMHGLTALQLIRRRHPLANIVVVTQFDHDTLRTRARAAGADNFIMKDDLTVLRSYVQTLASCDQ
jgi:DNA-binding NarL/FixJ family response regulator